MKTGTIAFAEQLGRSFHATLLIVTGLLALTLWCLPASIGLADDEEARSPKRESISTANFQSGVVTAVGSRDVRIDGADYPLDAHVLVTDDEGNPRELKVVVPETNVKYQVKKGRVTHIVIVLPK